MRFSDKIIILAGLLITKILYSVNPAESCQIYNRTFLPGEELSYIVAYNWFVVYTEVAEAVLTINKDTIHGKEAYHFSGSGYTFNWWDKIFNVRDRYDVWVNPENLRPYYFKKSIKEGNYRQKVSYLFNDEDRLTFSRYQTNDNPLEEDTIKISPCTFDVMSAMLWARNINFKQFGPGEKIPVTVILDRDSYDLYFRYIGEETIKVKGFGNVNCLKFTVLLVEGTIFNEGEDMFVWITNDKNRIPIYAESPILIGSVKVRLAEIKGNRYPISAIEKQ